MSHTFTGPQGTTFIYNSDLSGMVLAFVGQSPQWVEIPGADLVAFHEHVAGPAQYVPPSPEALEGLRAGIESARTEPLVTSDEDFSGYADDGPDRGHAIRLYVCKWYTREGDTGSGEVKAYSAEDAITQMNLELGRSGPFRMRVHSVEPKPEAR